MAILSENDLADGILSAHIDHDPNVTPTDVPDGSLLVRTDTDPPEYYVKESDGDTADASLLGGRDQVISINNDIVLAPRVNQLILVDASGGNINVTLPDPSTERGLKRTIKRVEATLANVVNILTPAGLIDGAASFVLNAVLGIFVTVTVESDGNNWFIVGARLA